MTALVPSTVAKIALNFGPSAARVLGPRQYARTCRAVARAMPQIVRSRNLRSVDAAMGTAPLRVRFMRQSFTVDCPACDGVTARTSDTSHTFGLIRELFVRNCYLRSLHLSNSPLAHVIDGGANRGLFSLFAASSGATVVAVEPAPAFCALIHHHMAINGITDYAVEQAVLGACTVPVAVTVPAPVVSIPDLLDRHAIPHIDLLKLDIEGAEFALFSAPAWLQHVSTLTMEVHAAHGRVSDIVATLLDEAFTVELRDVTLAVVPEPSRAAFLYATRTSGNRRRRRPAG